MLNTSELSRSLERFHAIGATRHICKAGANLLWPGDRSSARGPYRQSAGGSADSRRGIWSRADSSKSSLKHLVP